MWTKCVVLFCLHVHLIFLGRVSGSSSIKVRDERTGTVHLVGYHYITSCSTLNSKGLIILFLIALLHKGIYWNETTNSYGGQIYGKKHWGLGQTSWNYGRSCHVRNLICKCDFRCKPGHWYEFILAPSLWVKFFFPWWVCKLQKLTTNCIYFGFVFVFVSQMDI